MNTCMCPHTVSHYTHTHTHTQAWSVSKENSSSTFPLHQIQLLCSLCLTRPAWSCCCKKFSHLLFCCRIVCVCEFVCVPLWLRVCACLWSQFNHSLPLTCHSPPGMLERMVSLFAFNPEVVVEQPHS